MTPDPVCASPKANAARTLADLVLQDVYGMPPLIARCGGTVPVCEAFQRTMGLETRFFSFSVADEDFHAPNEFSG